MNEIWHTAGESNYNTLVIVIDNENRVYDFGFYNSEGIKPGY